MIQPSVKKGGGHPYFLEGTMKRRFLSFLAPLLIAALALPAPFGCREKHPSGGGFAQPHPLGWSLRPQPDRAGLEAKFHKAGLEQKPVQAMGISPETRRFVQGLEPFPPDLWEPDPGATFLMLEAMNYLVPLFPGSADRKARVLDVGTGTGVLILHAVENLGAGSGIATDVKPSALDFVKQKIEEKGLSQKVQLREGSLFDPVRGEKFDLILANSASSFMAENVLRSANSYLTKDGLLLFMWFWSERKEWYFKEVVAYEGNLFVAPILINGREFAIYAASPNPARIEEARQMVKQAISANPDRAGLEAERERVLWQGPFTSLRHQLKTRIHAWQQSGVPNIRVEYSSPIPWEGSEGRSAIATNFLLHGGITLRMLNEVVRSIVDDVETSMEISLPSKGTYQIVQVFKPMAGQISGGVDHIAIRLASSGGLEEKPQPAQAGLEGELVSIPRETSFSKIESLWNELRLKRNLPPTLKLPGWINLDGGRIVSSAKPSPSGTYHPHPSETLGAEDSDASLPQRAGLESEQVKQAQTRVDHAVYAFGGGRNQQLNWQVVGPSLIARYPALRHLKRLPHFLIDEGEGRSYYTAMEISTQRSPVGRVDYYTQKEQEWNHFKSAVWWANHEFHANVSLGEAPVSPETSAFKFFLQQLLANLKGLDQIGLFRLAEESGINLEQLAGDLELLEKV